MPDFASPCTGRSKKEAAPASGQNPDRGFPGAEISAGHLECRGALWYNAPRGVTPAARAEEDPIRYGTAAVYSEQKFIRQAAGRPLRQEVNGGETAHGAAQDHAGRDAMAPCGREVRQAFVSECHPRSGEADCAFRGVSTGSDSVFRTAAPGGSVPAAGRGGIRCSRAAHGRPGIRRGRDSEPDCLYSILIADQ